MVAYTHARVQMGGESRRQGSFLLSEKEERNDVSPGAYSNSTLIKILKKDNLSSFDKGKKIRGDPPTAGGGAQLSDNAP